MKNTLKKTVNIFKRFWIIGLVLLIFDPSVLIAQGGKFELTPFGGYMFGGRLRFYEGDLRLKDNANYGLAIDIEVSPDTKLELFWSQMQTSAEFKPFYGYDYLRGSFDLSINYFQIGAIREMGKDNIRPFGSFSLGTTYSSPKDNKISDDWRFSITLGGGVKIWLSDHIGIRLQARLLMPIYWGGVGIFAGWGSGGSSSGISLSAGSAILQGDLTGGLIFAFGD